MEPTCEKRDVFAIVTNRILEHLERGTVPWKKPWTDSGLPRNLVTGKPYHGINVWLLNALGYEQNIFLTFNQVKSLGGLIRAGEKSHLVIFWKWVEDEKNADFIDEQGKKLRPLLRYYLVFNVAQCSNLPEDFLPIAIPTSKNDPIKACEEVIDLMPHAPEIRHRGDEAYYHPFFDFINMPFRERFINSETYYATLFHELIHSTGHQTRLNRKELQIAAPKDFGAYSQEELTAEIGACYLSSYTGIDGWDFTNHVAYIQGWLEKLRNDKRCIVYASAQAQKATDYILNDRFRYTDHAITEDMLLKPPYNEELRS
jgi:antirestriction protein ArdC